MGTALAKRYDVYLRLPKPTRLSERLNEAAGCAQCTFIGFGLCGQCGGLIDAHRLDETPWTPWCAACAACASEDTMA